MDRTQVIIAGAIAVALGMVGLWALASQPIPGDSAPLVYIDSPDEMSGYVALARLGILTSENFVGHRIRVIEGTFVNVSDRTLRSVKLSLAFKSIEGNVVFETAEEGLSTPLPSGETRRYTFRFENLPSDWNYRVPDVTVNGVGY